MRDASAVLESADLAAASAVARVGISYPSRSDLAKEAKRLAHERGAELREAGLDLIAERGLIASSYDLRCQAVDALGLTRMSYAEASRLAYAVERDVDVDAVRSRDPGGYGHGDDPWVYDMPIQTPCDWLPKRTWYSKGFTLYRERRTPVLRRFRDYREADKAHYIHGGISALGTEIPRGIVLRLAALRVTGLLDECVAVGPTAAFAGHRVDPVILVMAEDETHEKAEAWFVGAWR